MKPIIIKVYIDDQLDDLSLNDILTNCELALEDIEGISKVEIEEPENES